MKRFLVFFAALAPWVPSTFGDEALSPFGVGSCYSNNRSAADNARWIPQMPIFGLAGSPMLDVWRGMGMNVVGEAFADRRYEPDGTLRSRKFPDALITDPCEAAAQALRLAREGKAQTVCVHGDTPGAVAILAACREALS